MRDIVEHRIRHRRNQQRKKQAKRLTTDDDYGDGTA
jgi:hypothetical protein